MRFLKSFFLFFIAFYTTVNAQVSNDYCNTAINLGTLPSPNACSDLINPGIGDTLNFNFTNVGATPGNPYPNVIGCNQTISSDVWFRTTLTGGQLAITVTGAFTNGVKITIFQDNCSNLTSWGCFSGPSPATYVCNNIMNGNTVLIQISGLGITDQAAFSLDISNNDDCAICNLGYNLVANPAPVNGTYLPGQTVNFCYTVNQWRMVGVNWLHGVQVGFGNGWDTTSLITYPVISQDGYGTWGWYDNDSSYNTGLEFPAGYYYQSILGDVYGGSPDTITGDNWGDYASGIIAPPWVFCWDVTTSTSMNPALTDLSILVGTTADGESGSWVNFGCAGDPQAFSSAVLVFCGFPTITTNPSCMNDSTGSASAAGQGIPPYDYLWTNTLGDTLQLDTNLNVSSFIDSLPVGVYTVLVADSTGCSQIVDVFINPLQESFFTYPDSMYCFIGANPIPDSIYLTGGVFSTNPSSLTINATTGEIDISTALADSTYTITYITNFTCGPDTTSVDILITDTTLSAYFSYADSIFCANSVSQSPDSIANLNFGLFYSLNPLVVIDPASGQITITPLMANDTFTVFHVTNYGCKDTASFTFSVSPTDIAYFTYPTDSICAGDPLLLPDSVTMPGGTFTMLTSFVIIDSVTGEIDPTTAYPNSILTIQYVTDSLCPTQSYQNIVVRQASSYFYYLNYQVCSEGADPIPAYVAMPGPDFWCSDTSLVIDSISGQIDISTMIMGNNYIIYHASSGSCVDTTTDIITLVDPFDPTFNYVGSQFCIGSGNAVPDTLVSSPGSFFSTPAGVTIANNTGIINLNTSTAGNYLLTHITSPICPDTTSITIDIIALDDSSFSYVSPTYCAFDDSLSSIPIAAMTGTYSSTPTGLILNSTTGEINLFTSAYGNTYTVIHVTDGFCPTSDSAVIDILLCNIVVLNAFTPNGDGVNDIWHVLGLEGYPGNHVSIFNRWGDIIFDADDYDNTTVYWNGLGISGTELPAGTYFFVIDMPLGGKISGYIELSR